MNDVLAGQLGNVAPTTSSISQQQQQRPMDVDVFDDAEVERALHSLTHYNGVKMNLQRNIVCRPPMLTDGDPGMVQRIMNRYLSEVLNLPNYTIYRLVQTMRGDSAVGYKAFAMYLYKKFYTNLPRDEFDCLADAMYNFYENWSHVVSALLPLVVNLNGADPVKEVMNVVNQSVYTLVVFVARSAGVSLPKFFVEVNWDAKRDEEHYVVDQALEIKQLALTNAFTYRLTTKLRAGEIAKVHERDTVLPSIQSLSEHKVYVARPYSINRLATFDIVEPGGPYTYAAAQ